MKRRRTASPSPSTPSRSSWRLAVTTALALLVSTSDATSYLHTGNGTAFFSSNISTAGCGLMSWPAIANTNYAAAVDPDVVPESVTRNTSACGRCARVWCDDDHCTSNTTSSLVYIIEDQPGSGPKDLNLAPEAFKTIAGFSSGRVSIRWRFVDCPVEQTAPDSEELDAPGTICVNRASSAHWLALQPVNDTLGIERVEVNGSPAPLMPSPSYFFALADPRGRLDLSQLTLSVTTRSRRTFQKVVAVQPGGCVGIFLRDELSIDDDPSDSSDGSSSSSSSSSPPTTEPSLTPTLIPTRRPSRSPSSSQAPTRKPIESPEPTRAPIDNGASGSGHASTPKTPAIPLTPMTPVSPPSPSASGGTTSPTTPTVPASDSPVKPAPDWSTDESPAPPAIIPRTPDSDSKETPGSSLTSTPIASKGSDGTIDPSVSFPAIRTTDIPPGDGPASLDRNARPTQTPPDESPGSKPVGIATTRPIESTFPPVNEGGSRNSQPPKPTPPGSSSLSRGVLTNPLFVGLLLGTVGLVGAIIAYRAKSRQQHLLAMAPPVASAHVTPRQTSRAAYSSEPVLGAL